MLCCVLGVFIASLSSLYCNIILQSDVSAVLPPELDVLAALRAEDVIPFGEEATANQGHGALLTVEAVIVPLALLKGNVLAASKA